MATLKKNILLTGAPSAGKTTIIKKVIQSLPMRSNGFYTEEQRSNGRRTGFVMHSLDGAKGYLAHETIESPFHIRRYGVSIKNIESIAVPAIAPIDSDLIILDEIGKMECFSKAFVEATKAALDAPNMVVGTITFGRTGFIQEIKERGDTEIVEVTEKNRDCLPEALLSMIEQFHSAM